jgi:iron complex outermembrane receptor protein
LGSVILISRLAAATDVNVVLRGHVLDLSNGTPLQNALVIVQETRISTKTDDKGEYRLTLESPGSYHLIASADFFYPLSTVVNAAYGETVTVDFELTSHAALADRKIVTVTGTPEQIDESVRSAAVIDSSSISVSRLAALDEVLNEVPGVKAESQSDTEELRISIRGRGVATSFGVESIKLLVDGVPESDAGGETTDLTGIDSGVLDHIEIVKGPMSTRYGATASGIVNLVTERGSPVTTLDLRQDLGSYDYVRSQAAIGGQYKALSYFFEGSRRFSHGFRANSRTDADRFNGRVDWKIDGKTLISFLGHGGISTDQFPGNLTLKQFQASPTQASPTFLFFGAHGDLDRGQGALRLQRDLFTNASFSLTGFYRQVDFKEALPSIFLNGVRPETGVDSRYTMSTRTGPITHQLFAGGSYQHEREMRRDFNNIAGEPGTKPQRRENRHVDNTSLYFIDELKPVRGLTISAGANYSYVDFRIDDFLGSRSGERPYSKVSYQVGAGYNVLPSLMLYGTFSTGFEAPTITELGRDPFHSTGINLNLQPEITKGGEVGARFHAARRLYVTAAAYQTKVTNEIVPTGIGFPQQTFANAAKTTHNGAELATELNVLPSLFLRTAYTYAHFYYNQYVNLAGKQFTGQNIPALPHNHLDWSLRYGGRWLMAGLTNEYVGSMFATDANNIQASSYTVTGFYVGYNQLEERFGVSLRYGVNNLFNDRYAAYIVPNDAFGGYFYPAPGRNYFGTILINHFLRRNH